MTPILLTNGEWKIPDNPSDVIGIQDVKIDASAAWDIELANPAVLFAVIDTIVALSRKDLGDKIVD